MSLFEEDSPKPVPEPDPIVIKPLPDGYNSEVIDTRTVPAATLLTHVEGSSWVVKEWYSQIKGGDNPLLGQQLNLPPHLQQYTKIKKLELKVTQDLRPSQDPSNNEQVMVGNANVFGGLIPNKGDMFVATNADGRLCVFKCTQSEKKSMLREAVYAVEYQMVYFAEKVYQDDFAAKTVRTLVFVSDYINFGQNPFLQEEAFDTMRSLTEYYNSIMRMWFRSFLSVEYNTLILPGQTLTIYDHFLTGAIQSVFNTWDAPEVRRVRRLNCDDDTNMKLSTLWDVIIQNDRFLMNEAIKRVGGLYTSRFTFAPSLDGIRYSGVRATVYPIDPVRSFDYQRTYKEQLVDEDIVLSKTMDWVPPTDGKPSLIKPVTIDDYYVLSKAFYDKVEGEQSLLEIQVNNWIEGETIDQRVLVALAESYNSWGGLERLYYGALLLILIKATIRSI